MAGWRLSGWRHRSVVSLPRACAASTPSLFGGAVGASDRSSAACTDTRPPAGHPDRFRAGLLSRRSGR